jgi:hypothetical protein
MSDKTENPYDMNSPSFDADKYLQKLLKVSLKLYDVLLKIDKNQISPVELQFEANHGYRGANRERHADTSQ